LEVLEAKALTSILVLNSPVDSGFPVAVTYPRNSKFCRHTHKVHLLSKNRITRLFLPPTQHPHNYLFDLGMHFSDDSNSFHVT